MPDDTKYGRYRLLRKIGSGSMGDVLLARAEGPQGFARLCAIKRVRGVHAEDPTYVKMFIDEARLVAQLSHPGIIQIFELGQEREGWFLAMEYVHGKSLRALQRALLDRGLTVSPELGAYIATRILAALAYVHDSKSPDGSPLRLIHRDVKPENVLLSFHGDVKLADFGIARAAGAPGLTQTGAIRGTLPYVTPEQISAGRVTPLIDVWAVGVVLYELLAGERPFRGKGDFETARSILRDTPAPLGAKNPTVPPQLATVIDRALQKDPSQRYQTAREMAAALEPLLIAANGRPVTDADVSRALRETFPQEPDSPLVDRIGEPLVEGGSVEVMVIEPSTSEALTTQASPGRVLSAPRRRRPAQVALLTAAAVLSVGLVAAWWVSRQDSAGARADEVAGLNARPQPGPSVDQPPGAGEQVGPAVAGQDAEARPGPTAAVAADAGAAGPPGGTSNAGRQPAGLADSKPASRPKPAPVAVAAKSGAAASRTGLLDIIVRPWANVFVEGESLGSTPIFSLSLPAGEHVLTMKNPELAIERRVKVRVDAGRTRRVTIDLEAGP